MTILLLAFLSSSRHQSMHSFPALWWTSSHSSTRASRSSGSWNAQTPTSLPTTWGDLLRWPWPSLVPSIHLCHAHSLMTGPSSVPLCGGLQVKSGFTPFSFACAWGRLVGLSWCCSSLRGNLSLTVRFPCTFLLLLFWDDRYDLRQDPCRES